MNRARRLLHRDSAPILSFSGFGDKKKEEKERRKSDAIPTSQPVQQAQANQGPLPKFYIKGINRDKAEEILSHQPIGTYLVRDRETATNPGSYTLSLRHKIGLKHHKIETHPTTNKIIIAGYERFQFDTLEQLTEFFVRTQKKDIALVPYDPDAVCTSMSNMSIEQPSYEEMDAPEDQENGDMYLEMDEGCLGVDIPGRAHYQNGNGPPPLPNRGRTGPGPQSYENLSRPQKGVPPRHNPQSINSYENLPEKGAPPLSPVDPSAPPIPPRVPPSSGQGYENMPGKSCPRPQPGSYENTPPRHPPQPCTDSYQNVPDRLPKGPPIPNSYQNVPDRASQGPPIPERHPKLGAGYENYTNKPTGYENYFSKDSKKTSGPQPGLAAYQNLPPKVAPRRKTTQVNYSAEQPLPRRQPVPIRRVKTDTERDYIARRQ